MQRQSTISLPRWPTVLAAMFMLCASGLIAHAGMPARQSFFIPGIEHRPVLSGVPDTLYVSSLSHAGFTARVTDYGGLPPITATGLPPFAQFVDHGDGTATLSAICADDDRGSYDVLIVADDGVYADSARVLLCVLYPPNHPPVWIDVPDTIWDVVNWPTVVDLHPTDLDSLPLHVTAVDLPTFATLTDLHDNRNTTRLTIYPRNGQEGIYTTQFIVSDDVLADTATVTIRILLSCSTRWINPPLSLAAPIGDTTRYVLYAEDCMERVVPMTANVLPSFAKFVDNKDGSALLTLTPTAASRGLHTFKATAASSFSSSVLQRDILVDYPSSEVVFWSSIPDTVTLRVFETPTIRVSAVDPKGSKPTLSVTGLPSFGTFSDNRNGTGDLKLKPTWPDTGRYVLTFKASTTASSALATVIVQIRMQDPERAPSWVDVPDSIFVATNTSPSFRWNAPDPDGNAVSFTVLNVPSFARYSGLPSGKFDFYPKPLFADTGAYTMTVIASDGLLADTAVIVVVVPVPSNSPPIWIDAPDTITAAAGEWASLIVEAFDSNRTVPSLSMLPAIDEVRFSDRGDGSGVLSVAFSVVPPSPATVQLSATDGVNTTIHDITIIVVPASPADTTYPGEYVTKQMLRYETGGNIDQLRLQDLDGDGLDEIIFRSFGSTVYEANLRILTPATGREWNLPTVPGGLRGFSLRQGTAGLEPVVWSFNGSVMMLSADHTSWDTWRTMPDSVVKFEWLSGSGDDAQLVVSVDNSRIYNYTDPQGCPYYSSYSEADLRVLTSNGYAGHWKDLASASGSGNSRYDFIQVFDADNLVDVLIPRYDRHQESGCSPNSYHYFTNYGLYSLGLLSLEPTKLDWFFTDDYMQMQNTKVYNFFSGHGRWHSPGDNLIRMAWVSNIPPYFVTWNYKWRLTIATYDNGWSIQDHVFNLISQPATGGLVTRDSDPEEFMLAIPIGEPGYLLSMEDASRVGRVSLAFGNRDPFTGYVLDRQHRDLVYIDNGAIEVQRVITDPDLPPTPVVIRVPADVPTIADAMAQAHGGDTIRVGPGTYVEPPLDTEGRPLHIVSDSGAAVTILRPQTPTASLLTFQGASGASTLAGFTISGCAGLVGIGVQDCPDVRMENNVFRDNPVGNLVVQVRASTALIQRNLFVGNGGISCIGAYSDHVTIENNTFTGNARGYLTNTDVAVSRNNIIVNSNVYGIFGRALDNDYNLVWNNHPDYESNVVPGVHDLSTDPLFVDPASGDYHLQPASPCIDAGDPSAIFNDPDGSRSDIGAYPFTGEIPHVGDANGDGVVDMRDAVILIDRADTQSARRVLQELFRK